VVVDLKKNDGCLGRLMQGEGRAETPSALTRAVKSHQVGSQSLDDGAVACAEIAAAAVEAELPPWRHDGEPKLEIVLETVRLEEEFERRCAVELAPAEEV
jgi:hypothetical protein